MFERSSRCPRAASLWSEGCVHPSLFKVSNAVCHVVRLIPDIPVGRLLFCG